MADTADTDAPPPESPVVVFVRPALALLLTLGSLAWSGDVYRSLGLALFIEQFLSAMLGLALALEPKVLMLDEPTAGMAVDEAPAFLDLIASIKKDSSKTILLVEHKMDVGRALADRIVVLRRGSKVADKATASTSPEEITGLITGAIEHA